MIDQSKSSDLEQRRQTVDLVGRMLTLHRQLSLAKTPHDKESLQRQIEATDQQIDRLAYEL